jgi:hypothetical protein
MALENDDECHTTELSSPPCYMSDVDPAYMGLADAGLDTERQVVTHVKIVFGVSSDSRRSECS